MRACDIHDHFAPHRAWLAPEQQCDGIKLGDPQTLVRGIAVMWKPRLDHIKAAVERGCNFILAHESVFRAGGSGDETPIVQPPEQPKLTWLQEHGIVCYRCHDGWDVYPEIGVRDAWTRGLGYELTHPLTDYPYMRVVDAGGIAFGDLCRHVLQRVRPLGQQMIIARGDERRPIRRLTLSTGAANDHARIVQTQPDACIVSDDYFRHVRDAVFLEEANIAYIVLNHGTLEEWGIRNLYEYAKKAFAPVPVHFFPQGCTFRVVS